MKNTTIGIIIGILLTITILSVWTLVKQNSRISSLENFATQVANIINQASNQASVQK